MHDLMLVKPHAHVGRIDRTKLKLGQWLHVSPWTEQYLVAIAYVVRKRQSDLHVGPVEPDHLTARRDRRRRCVIAHNHADLHARRRGKTEHEPTSERDDV